MALTITAAGMLADETYDERLKAFMKLLEGQVLDVYVDFTGAGQRANPSIGWGFALNQTFSETNPTDRNPEALNHLIPVVLGVNSVREGLSAVPQAREAPYEQSLRDGLNLNWPSDPTTNQSGMSTLALRSNLNEILEARASEIGTATYAESDRIAIGTPKTRFKHDTTEQIAATFDAFKDEKERKSCSGGMAGRDCAA